MSFDKQFAYSNLFTVRAVEEWPPPMDTSHKGSGPPPITFAYGLPDPGSFPFKDLIEATTRVLGGRGQVALQYGPQRGYDGLLDVVVEKLAREENLEASRDELLLTNGSSQALDMLCQVFVNPGDAVIVEAPCFHGALDTLRRLQAKPVHVTIDDEGIRTVELAETVERLCRENRKPKFIYTVPNFHNPAGVTMSVPRRQGLLSVAREYGVVIVEDDAYRELCYEGNPLPSLYSLDRDGLVVRMGTFSKILSAGMRLGWVLGPERVIAKMLLFKFDTGTNHFACHVAAEYSREHLQQHIVELIDIYRCKRDAMLSALDANVASLARWTVPKGGFYIWMDLPGSIDPDALRQTAAEEGVVYLSGHVCFVDGRGKDALRLSFSFPGTDEIDEGIRRLGNALRTASAKR
ncbi:MAG: PLP-dependent aminotransferase family protein [Chloroflexi bacterium]|nr:PLP-dependent aminotransferase family protein [Chloroflexota bacterium]